MSGGRSHPRLATDGQARCHGRCHSVPRKVAGSLLSDWYPQSAGALPNYRTQLGEARQIVPPPDAWDIEPVPFARLQSSPVYSAGAVASAERDLHCVWKALQRLLNDRIWLGYPITEQRGPAPFSRLARAYAPPIPWLHGNVGLMLPPLLDDNRMRAKGRERPCD